MKRSLLILAALMLVISCAKEEFAINKGQINSSSGLVASSETKLCSQMTLIKPKVDILMMWDNSTSFNYLNASTKTALQSLITSEVFSKFDYHILSVPLVADTVTSTYQGFVLASDPTSLNGNALTMLKTQNEITNQNFSTSLLSNEFGIDRAFHLIQNNRSNGIFRENGYTIIIVMSNEDDDSCEYETPYGTCTKSDWEQRANTKINKLLCLRGNTTVNCNGLGIAPLNSSMMRFFNISSLLPGGCAPQGLANERYRKVAANLYTAPYSNDWPTSNDHISPDVTGAPDSYNICALNPTKVFAGLETSITQVILNHKYDYWPVAISNAVFDPDTIRVEKLPSRTILSNRAANPNATDGYELITDGSGNPLTVTQNTRYEPTAGEPFTGKMIRLYNNDRVVYPECLKISFSEPKKEYGYIYLSNGAPVVSSLEIRLTGQLANGTFVNNALVPQSTTNGWDYMGLQNSGGLDTTLRVFNAPPGFASGPIIRLNGNWKVKNTTTSGAQATVLYTSAATP